MTGRTSRNPRALEAFEARRAEVFEHTDRMFGVLMLVQWVAAIAAAAWIAPRTWSGTMSAVHVHMWAAVLLGGALAVFPVFLVLTQPGAPRTRFVVGIAQALFSALLIHLTGGRIETHFHIFGSLAFLAFYRDVRVLLIAAAVVAVDHFARGVFWPESVYGVLDAPLWRSFEHAGWVVFEVAFLIVATRRSVREMWSIAERQAAQEAAHEHVESLVRERTEELRQAEARHRAIVETAVDGIITFDDAGRIRSFNPAAEAIFGRRADEVAGAELAVLVAEGEPDTATDELLTAAVAGVRREVEGRRADGSTFPLDLAVSPAHDGLHTAVARDVTEAKAVDRMKTEFVSTVSHELRTPLTSIRGSLGLIHGGVAGELPAEASRLLGIAHNNCERLVRLVNDILDIEKIESGRMEFTFEVADLVEVVEDAVAANQGFAAEHDVSLEFVGREVDASVEVDRDRVTQVLTNLISNAVKFSPAGGVVRLEVGVADSRVRVDVVDAGPGIPDEFRARIFGKFAQADSSDVRQKGGTGLGLSISKAIVESHGGQIGFDSEVGAGTRFYFEVPRFQPGAAAPSREIGGAAARMLVCEDDADVASLLVMILGRAGVECDVAGTAEAARERLAEREYDAMTLDLMLPGEGGLDLLQSLRLDERTRELPVIVISAIADTTSAASGAGALDVVSWIDKPIEQAELVEAVRSAAFGADAATSSVLHVEPDDDLAEVVRHTLRDVATVVRARSVDEARELMKTRFFDLVLLEVDLPGGSGLDLVPESPIDGMAPFVVYSSSDAADARTDGCAAVFLKARTSEDQLARTIASLVKCQSRRSVTP